MFKMKKLYSLLLIVALVCLISLNAASAADVNGNNFTALNDTISHNKDINLKNNIIVNDSEITDFAEGIIINESKTINGNGFSIDGNNKVRIFNITNSSAVLTLKNITLKNGNATGGSAINCDGTVNLICNNNVIFENNGNNDTKNTGGVICSANGDVIIKGTDDLTFKYNTAYLGGAIYASNNVMINITGSMVFLSNEAYEGAAINAYKGNVTLIANDRISFILNYAENEGGAIYSRENVIVNGSERVYFTANEALKTGGAIYASKDVIFNVDEDVYCSLDIADVAGVIYTSSGNVIFNVIGDLNIRSNEAINSTNGIIYAADGNVTFNVNGNTSLYYNKDGTDGCVIRADNVNMRNVLFTIDEGTLIYLQDGSNSSVNNCYWDYNYEDKDEIIDAKLIYNETAGKYIAPDYWVLLNLIVPDKIKAANDNYFRVEFNKLTNGTDTIDYGEFKNMIVLEVDINNAVAPQYVWSHDSFNVVPYDTSLSILRIVNSYNNDILITYRFYPEPMDSYLNVEVKNATYGDKVTIYVQLTGDDLKVINGKVNLTIGKETQVVNVINGVGQASFYGLNAGNYTAEAFWAGDKNHNNISASADFNVAKKEIFISADRIIMYEGQVGNLRVVVSEDVDGNITIKYANQTQTDILIGGKCYFTIADLPVGYYDVIVNFSGNSNYFAKDTQTYISIAKNPVNSTMDINVNDAVFPNYNYVTIDLAYNNGTPISDFVDIFVYDLNGKQVLHKNVHVNGTLKTILPVFYPGIYHVVVSYKGNDTVNPVSKSAAFYLKKATINMDLLLDTIIYGENGILYINASNNFTGTVKVFVNDEFVSDVELEDGYGNLSLKNYDADIYNVVVSYSGNKFYEASNVTTPWIVNKAKTELTIDIDDITYGEDATLDIYTNTSLNETVRVFVNGNFVNFVTLENGTGTITLSGYNANKYNVEVMFNGNKNFKGHITTTTWNVEKADVTFVIDSENIVFGQDETITVNVGNNLNGFVILSGLFDDGITVLINDGTGSITLSNLAPNDYNIVGIFLPNDSNYKTQLNISSFSVIDENIYIEMENLQKYYANSEKLEAILVDGEGNVLVNETVTFIINGVSYNRITDENGTARLAINLNPGQYPVKVTYSEVESYATVTILTTIGASDIGLMYKNGTKYEAIFFDENGTLLTNTNVTFNINGVFYTRTTNNEGRASLTINLNPGEYTITAYNPVTGQAHSNTVTVYSPVVGLDLIKNYTEKAAYEVYAFDNQGNPLANATITININGVFYTRITDENGIARLNINLAPGEYTATASFNGALTSNKITVLEA